jgi:hypothetical protein
MGFLSDFSFGAEATEGGLPGDVEPLDTLSRHFNSLLSEPLLMEAADDEGVDVFVE